jgi:glucose uptake protein GlcU
MAAFISGVMWGIAQACWFLANDALGFSIAFPIICTGPGLVSALWGIFLFGEIQGRKNFIALSIACCFTLSSSICIALSS